MARPAATGHPDSTRQRPDDTTKRQAPGRTSSRGISVAARRSGPPARCPAVPGSDEGPDGSRGELFLSAPGQRDWPHHSGRMRWSRGTGRTICDPSRPAQQPFPSAACTGCWIFTLSNLVNGGALRLPGLPAVAWPGFPVRVIEMNALHEQLAGVSSQRSRLYRRMQRARSRLCFPVLSCSFPGLARISGHSEHVLSGVFPRKRGLWYESGSCAGRLTSGYR
jgi:hypothetical protein